MKVKKKKSLPYSKLNLSIIAILAVGITSFLFIIFRGVVFSHGGDISLIHACINSNNGKIRIVAPNDVCGTNETAYDWIRNVFAGTGLTISSASEGATLFADTTYLQRRVSQSCSAGSAIKSIAADGTVTCAPVTASVTRYQSSGSGIPAPNGDWQDVPGATITQTFNAGTVKVSYVGSIVMRNGDGTAYVRMKYQPTGGTVSYIGDTTVFRSSSASVQEYSNIPFTSQGVITVSAGQYSITPQFNINNPNWGLFYVNNLSVEQ